MQKNTNNLNFEFRVRLQEEISRRIRSNERYSVRAFARWLGMDSSSLSQVLSGKRTLSDKKIKELSQKIGLHISATEGPAFSLVDMDTFSVISDWYHFAILDLTLLKGFKSEISWIAKTLNIEAFKVRLVIERLLRLGMLTEHKGRWQKAQEFYTNYTEGSTSAALKEYQRQIIRKALQAVDEIPQERKDITSITIAADSKKLKEAKEMIKKFRRELCQFMEQGEKDAVFHLAIQLYPVTEQKEE